jgi:hypothetical protein
MYLRSAFRIYLLLQTFRLVGDLVWFLVWMCALVLSISAHKVSDVNRFLQRAFNMHSHYCGHSVREGQRSHGAEFKANGMLRDERLSCGRSYGCLARSAAPAIGVLVRMAIVSLHVYKLCAG